MAIERGLLIRLNELLPNNYEVDGVNILGFSPDTPIGTNMTITLTINVSDVVYFDKPLTPEEAGKELENICKNEKINAVYLEQPVERKIINMICEVLMFAFLKFEGDTRERGSSADVKVDGLSVKMKGEKSEKTKGKELASPEILATLNLNFIASGGKVNKSGGS